MPVLADAGTAVAAREGRAVCAVARADSRGSGMVGTPTCAARPRGGVPAWARGLGMAGLFSIVRMTGGPSAEGRRRCRGVDPPGLNHHARGRRGCSPVFGEGLTSTERVVRGSNLCGASHALVWRKSPRMRVRVQGHLTDSGGETAWPATGRRYVVTQGDATMSSSTHRSGSLAFRKNWA